MSDDKIITEYICSICHRGYSKRENAEQCVKSHESDEWIRQIELGFVLGSKEYGFFERTFRLSKENNSPLKTDVSVFGLYDGYPKFMVECHDIPTDIFAAKKRLIEVAHEWADKYKDVLAGLERELAGEVE